ncbi:hypothetical protein BCR35DRAFT_57704 [Leucosporidium creatinivorum]|uniref:F-box domain-containing protein n=1 Tax=Leucosporidium creatinivorum TaxID=106004 RepID=A0A1Y2FKY1_9BASI|nr:hypothetical protein BCR35DRAFT_57704 [Leucosporidium creatinivorum]
MSSNMEKPAKRARSSSPPSDHAEHDIKLISKDGLELLLQMPLDVVAEICSHLPVPDLLNLARSSKGLRSLVLSRSFRPVWARARRGMALGLPDLEAIDMDEIQYALWVFGSGRCQRCNATSWQGVSMRTWDLMITECSKCRESSLIPVNKLKRGLRNGLSDLHESTLSCVPTFTPVDPYRNKPAKETVSRRDLVSQLNDKLNKLQALDEQETAERAILQLRAKGSTSKKAMAPVSVEWDLSTPHTSRVDAFVAKKMLWLEKFKTEATAIKKGINKYEAQLAKLAREQANRESAARRQKEQALKKAIIDSGWTEELYNTWNSSRRYSKPRPDTTPQTDPAYWTAAKAAAESTLAAQQAHQRQEAERRALQSRQASRKSQIAKRYNRLRDAETGDATHTFPSLDAFYGFEAIKPFWEKDDGTKLNEETWTSSLRAIRKQIAAFVAKKRKEVIQQILVATTNASYAALPTSPDDYSPTHYPSSWFAPVTRQFIQQSTYNSLRLVKYPDVLSANRSSYSHGYGYSYLSSYNYFNTTSDRVQTIRSILSAADLDEATATEADLDALDGRLHWVQQPKSRKKRRGG